LKPPKELAPTFWNPIPGTDTLSYGCPMDSSDHPPNMLGTDHLWKMR
jgi:hypothetical protein